MLLCFHWNVFKYDVSMKEFILSMSCFIEIHSVYLIFIYKCCP